MAHRGANQHVVDNGFGKNVEKNREELRRPEYLKDMLSNFFKKVRLLTSREKRQKSHPNTEMKVRCGKN